MARRQRRRWIGNPQWERGELLSRAQVTELLSIIDLIDDKDEREAIVRLMAYKYYFKGVQHRWIRSVRKRYDNLIQEQGLQLTGPTQKKGLL